MVRVKGFTTVNEYLWPFPNYDESSACVNRHLAQAGTACDFWEQTVTKIDKKFIVHIAQNLSRDFRIIYL